MNKQRGGTLLGVIIGALLGLGAALAVAVYVTKVPVPFLNKGQSRSAESDAQEAKKNKDWDPNAPLAGKNAPRPAAVASGPVATDSPAGAPAAAASVPKTAAVAALPTPAASAAAPARPAVSNDPLGDLAKARSEVDRKSVV